MSLGASVESVIETVGERLILRKPAAGGVFDDDTGAYTTSPSDSDSSFWGRVSRFDSRLVNGSTILSGDLEIIAVGFESTVAPAPGDEVIRNSRSHSVIAADPEVIGEDVMFYRLQVRGT